MVEASSLCSSAKAAVLNNMKRCEIYVLLSTHQIISCLAFMKSREKEPSGNSWATHLTPSKELLSR